MSKKVLVPLAEGVEEIEAITIIDVLRRANIEVVTASLTDNLDVKGSHSLFIKADTTLEKIMNYDFDAIALPGGMVGMNNLKADMRVLEKIRDMYESKKLVSAICASPIVLGEAGVINGKYTCYPSCEIYVKGGEYGKKQPCPNKPADKTYHGAFKIPAENGREKTEKQGRPRITCW